MTVTPGSTELLALANEIEDHNPTIDDERISEIYVTAKSRALIVSALRLAAKPAEEGVRTALVDARPYLASAFKRSQHAYDKAALEQVDDAIRALSTTGQPK